MHDVTVVFEDGEVDFEATEWSVVGEWLTIVEQDERVRVFPARRIRHVVARERDARPVASLTSVDFDDLPLPEGYLP